MAQRATFSSYKHKNTIKYLTHISGAGACLWVSFGFGGRAGDYDTFEVSLNWDTDFGYEVGAPEQQQDA